MKMLRLALPSALLLASCSGPTVAVDVRFPSQTAFIASSLVDFEMVPLSADTLGRCPELVADALSDAELGATTSVLGVPRCDVRRGVSLPDPGAGPYAFVVQALSDSNATLLVGCSVGEVYSGGPPIRVDLFPTTDFPEAAAEVTPGQTVDGACP